MNITSTPKRLRAPRRIMERFLYLEVNDGFYIGRCAYVKTGFFKATTRVVSAHAFRTITLPPWRKVLVDRPIGDFADAPVLCGPPFVVDEGTIEGVPGKTLSEAIHDRALRVPNDGITHFVGDDCPGGHAETADEMKAAKAQARYECACKGFQGRVIHANSGPSPEENLLCGCPEGPKGVAGEAGIPVPQPHSDNNITGPTS